MYTYICIYIIYIYIYKFNDNEYTFRIFLDELQHLYYKSDIDDKLNNILLRR